MRNKLLQFFRIDFQSDRTVGENDDFIIAPFVITNEKLTSTKFVWIHHAEQ